MGPSLGGMVVLAFVAQFPGAARRLVSVSGTAAASPFAIALRSIQREAITSDPDWQHGHYTADKPPRSGQRLARKLGTVTYRSAAEWKLRFDREPIRPDMKKGDPFASEFAVQGYLESQAAKFVTAFDANCYLYLSRAMDRFDLGKHGEHVEVLRRAQLEQALVIGVETDLPVLDLGATCCRSLPRRGRSYNLLQTPRLHRGARLVPHRSGAIRARNPEFFGPAVGARGGGAGSAGAGRGTDQRRGRWHRAASRVSLRHSGPSSVNGGVPGDHR